MTETDKRFHPWPPEGKSFEFRWRKATWCIVRPWYGYNSMFVPLTAVRFMFPVTFWFPFLTIRTKYFHCYYEWKPITLDDPGFYWRDLDVVKQWRAEGRLFVQGGARQGTGSIS